MPTFFEALEARVAENESLLCVGLDPHPRDLAGDVSAGAALAFCKRIVDATAGSAAAFKPNAAFFEALGPSGVEALTEVVAYCHAKGAPVLLDCKRGDIASTAEAYAAAAYDAIGADATTVHPYMGVDSVAPFSAGARSANGVFVLCKTSNPSSSELQELRLADGRLVYEAVADAACTAWSADRNVGLVVGATDTEALKRVRARAPDAWLLTPGVGAQGGSLTAALATGLRSDGSGMLVPVSRGISRADDPGAAAEDLRVKIQAARTARSATDGGRGGAGGVAGRKLAGYQQEFIDIAVSCGVLKFGTFTLKSGRVSPYFFNAGLFNTGAAVLKLGQTYAAAIQRSGIEFDVLFGPAYKGIPLVTTAAVALASVGVDVPVAYNRKEAKDHGEGGVLVGADIRGRRVLVLDDVISAGTAIGEAVDIIKAAGGTIAGVVIALDRQEVGNDGSGKAAVEQVRERHGIPIEAVIKLDDLIAYMRETESSGEGGVADVLPQMEAYRAKYGSTE